MKMNDNTILRIKVPAHLYESVKAQLTLNEANLTLQNYARKLYSLFKKSGATPLVVTGKNFASPDVKNSNVSIGVSGDKLHVGIKGSKDIGKKYADLVAKEFTDLQLQGQITQSGWGGQNDATYTDLTLVPKTTGKKGGTTVTETEDTIKEAKLNFGTKDMKPVKGQKAAGASSDKPKASAPKKAAAPKNAEAPKEEAKVPHDGMKKAPKKKLGLEELKAIVELLNGEIAQLEEKKAPAEDEKEKMEEVKDKVEEKKEEMEESKWGREEYMDEPDYDEKRQRFVRYQPKKTFRPKYVPKGQATMTPGDVGKSSMSKFDPTMDPEDPRGGFR